ncbi:MAG: thioredoxin [Bacteroidales bacterium]|nr:thioredoxin [Bacteroidales bacterium]
MALAITSQNFEEVVKSGKLVVIDFWATRCGPCRALGPIIEELAEDYKDKVVICKCDVDSEQELAMKFQVMSIPKVVFLKDGEIKDMQVGLTSKEVLSAKIENLL